MILDPTPKLLDQSAEDYHRDHSRVSHSMLEVFMESRRLFEGRYVTHEFEHETTDKMDLGKAAHALALEASVIYVEIPPEVLAKNGAKSGNAWKEYEAAHPGQILLKPDQVENIHKMTRALQSHPKAKDLIESPGRREVVVTWTDEETGLDMKARLDVLRENFRWIADMKGTGIIEERRWSRHCYDMGYHRQAALYVDAIREISKAEPTFFFVPVLDKEPHTVDVFELSDVYLQIGREENAAALRQLAECYQTGDWSEPGFGIIKTISPPAFVEREFFSRT